MTILVVDDEPAILQLLASYLTRNGHTVQTADTGKAALALVKPDTFDFALVDLTLPDISGMDVATGILKQTSATVILASGYQIDSSMVPAEFRPRVKILHKPFMPKTVLELIAS